MWGTSIEDIVEFVGNSWYQFWDAKEIVGMLEQYYDLDPETGYMYVMQWLDDTYSYMRWIE